MSEKEHPNYHAILPADVRYDTRLKPMARLLFAELSALTNTRGYSWASNRYFSKLYEVSPDTVSRWLKQLEKYEYIEIEYNNTDSSQERRIFLKTCMIQRTPRKKVGGGGGAPRKKVGGPPVKKSIPTIYNNTRLIQKDIPTQKGNDLSLCPSDTDKIGGIKPRASKRVLVRLKEKASKLCKTDFNQFIETMSDLYILPDKYMKGELDDTGTG